MNKLFLCCKLQHLSVCPAAHWANKPGSVTLKAAAGIQGEERSYVTIKAVKMEGKDRLREVWEVGSTGKEADSVSLLRNKVSIPQTRCFKQQNFIVSQF